MSLPYENERPRFIVIFGEPIEKNVSTISRVLGVGEEKGVSTRGSCTVLAASDGTHPRVYNRLGVAATDLTEDQFQQLRREDNVLDIVLNQVRTIPPSYFEHESPAVSAGASGDPLAAYLRGMRDAVDAVQRFYLGDSQESQLFPPPQIAGTLPSHSWCLEAIGISPNSQYPTGQGVCVAVLDTGIDLNHPDFQDRVMLDDNAVSFIAGETVQDGNGHGTHCAGVVAGPVQSSSNRRYGVAPDVHLLVGKVLNDNGRGSDDKILYGIDWAVDQGAQIISMSFGSDRKCNQPFDSLYEQVAYILLRRNILTVAAAGNSSNRPQRYYSPVGNPAACPSIKAIASVDRSGRVAADSCAQVDEIGAIDISAPGVGVYSAWKNGGFASKSGTSMATPHVAGVAALYYQRYFEGEITASDIWQMMVNNALPLGNSDDFGSGLVQVAK